MFPCSTRSRSVRTTLLCVALTAAAIASGCYSGSTPEDHAPALTNVDVTLKNEVISEDVPCDVAAVLSLHCVRCHGDPLFGAPNRLMTYDDLIKPSAIDPKKTVAQLCVDRIEDGSRPMPPVSPFEISHDVVSELQLKAFKAWAYGKAEPGTCSVLQPYTPHVIDFTTGTTSCSGSSKWTEGEEGADEMKPGVPCIACHKERFEKEKRREARIYTAAGTIYSSAHVNDDCFGVSTTKVTIQITDLAGKLYAEMPIRRGGNFFTSTKLPTTPRGDPLPYRARIHFKDGTPDIPMLTPQTDGDCNRCHGVSGKDDAPGRIVLPE